MEDLEIEEFYRRRAKDHVNMLFDKNLLNPELSREGIQWLEDYMAFIFQSDAKMTEKTTLLIARLKDKS